MSGINISQRWLSRRHLLGGAAAGAGLVALSCRGGGRGGSAPKTASTKPRAGGRVTLGLTDDPRDFDPTYFGTSPTACSLAYAYEPLLRFKRGPGVKYGDLVVAPELAEKWESPDAQTYTFHLRQGVRFANLPPVNGRELTSADAQWSYEYLARTGALADKKLPKNRFNWFFQGLDRVEAPDASTVVMHFQHPFVPFLHYSALDFNPVLSHEIFDQYGSFKDHIAGTGPWQLDIANSERGSHWLFKRNPTYWQTGLPYVDEVQWLIIPDTAGMASAFVSDQLDWAGSGVSYPDSLDLKKRKPNAQEFVYTLAPLHLYLNLREPPLSDIRVRQAISNAIDRDAFIRTFSGGQGAWALAGAFPDTFSQAEVKQILHHDPQKAKQLLKEAGYPNGLGLQCKYATQFGSIYVSEVQLLQSQLKQVGIDLTLQSVTSAERGMDEVQGKFQIIPSPKDLEGDVDSYLGGVYHSGAGYNFGGSNDPKLDAMLNAEQREADPKKRTELVRQAVRYINETVQGLAIFAPPSYEFAQPRLKNYYPQAFVREIPSADSWLAG